MSATRGREGVVGTRRTCSSVCSALTGTRTCNVLQTGTEEVTDSAVRAQVIEAAFKNETVGLVTREEFLNKRNTLQARQDEEVARVKRAAEAALQQVCRTNPRP